MDHALTRRSWLAATAAGAAAIGLPAAGASAAAPAAEILETKVITPAGWSYCGWPTVGRRANGQLVATCSGNRVAHVCPFGQVQMLTSDDDGESWTWPRTLLDGVIDDRDSGVLETAKGTLLVTTFTSLAYEPALAKANKDKNWPAEKLASWNAVNARLPA